MRTYHRHLAVRVSPSFVLFIALATVNMRLWQQHVSISVNPYKGTLRTYHSWLATWVICYSACQETWVSVYRIRHVQLTALTLCRSSVFVKSNPFFGWGLWCSLSVVEAWLLHRPKKCSYLQTELSRWACRSSFHARFRECMYLSPDLIDALKPSALTVRSFSIASVRVTHTVKLLL